MRKLALIGCLIVLVVAAPFAASAQTVTAQAKAKIAAILAQYPNGGPQLASAIAKAVEEDPSLAAAAVEAAADGNAAQQQAIGLGLATAATYFATLAGRGGPNAEAAADAQQLILSAMASATALTQAGFSAGGGFDTAAVISGAGGGTGLTTNKDNGKCISPSKGRGNC